MALYKIGDFNPNYRQEAFDGDDVKGLDVYAGTTNEKIGTIHDVLVDETGRFRYLVIDTGFWIFGKKVLLPVGRCHVDANARRVYAMGLANKEQAEQLPEYDDTMTVDYDYEERVRGVYRTPTVEQSVPVEMTPPVETSTAASGVVEEYTTTRQRPVPSPRPATPAYTRDTYTYDREPTMYQMSDRDHQKLRLYEERLVTSKSRRKTGEVHIGKHVETETARVSVPVEKERLVIERTPADAATGVTPSNAAFREGEVARVEIYEEDANIRKQAFVREEVNVSKEVVQNTVDATETLRHEELDVKTDRNLEVEQRNRRPNDRI
ncbi:MAG TPA: DUF2382 domain-containing protein [Coleofasciculaceae cyanobacterium]